MSSRPSRVVGRIALIFAATIVAWTPRATAQAGNETGVLFGFGANGQWGYIDRAGTVVVEAQYINTQPFYEGLAAVMVGNKWGFIDTTGKMVIEPRFLQVWEFSEGLAVVVPGAIGTGGYFDKTGELVIPDKFLGALSFTDGLAAVRIGQEHGYIDPTGKFIWGPAKP